MASLIEQMFGAMPLTAAAAQAASWGSSFQAVPQGILYYYCQPLAPGDFKGAEVSAPVPTETPNTDGNNPAIPIWGYTQGSAPNVVDGLKCRVVTDAFRNYVVCDEIRFGRVLPLTTFQEKIVVRAYGRRYDLPLSNEFRLATFRTRSGLENPERSSLQLAPGTPPVRLYPLAATYDASTVHAYVYDLPIETEYAYDPEAPPVDEPIPVELPLSVSDPDAYARLNGNLARASDVAAGVASRPTADPGLNLSEDESLLVQDTLLADDDWMPVPDEVCAETDGPIAGVMPLPARVLVLVSLTVCRERGDFTPSLGGVANLTGVARVYPQVLVKATIPLQAIETAVRYTRPARTTIDDGKACGCSEMRDAIGGGLWADRNGIMPSIPIGSAPFGGLGVGLALAQAGPTWDVLFDYRSTDVLSDTRKQPITLVHPKRTKSRLMDGAVERGGKSSTSIWGQTPSVLPTPGMVSRAAVRKLARQGAFDNIHLAPRMRFPPGTTVHHGTWHPSNHPGVNLADVVVEPGHAVDLEHIVMAPICAHDCFHVHWRWTNAGVQAPQMGWSDSAPNAVPGATMIPQHHELRLFSEADNQVVLIEEAVPESAIPADTFELFFGFGAGFAVSAGTVGFAAVRAQMNLASEVYFVDPANPSDRITPENSWAAFYVTLQFAFHIDSNGALCVSERLHQVVHLSSLMGL